MLYENYLLLFGNKNCAMINANVVKKVLAMVFKSVYQNMLKPPASAKNKTR
jgi:hypothetical protein